MLEEIDPTTIQDEATRALVVKLLNLLENALYEVQTLKEEVQRLRDENNRLKGEKGQADLKPANKNYSSRNRPTRPPKKGESKGGKKARLVITRTEKLSLDRQNLPPDVEFKGYEAVVVQEVVLRPEVICFKKEKFYSPSHQMTYLAPLPPGFEGQFGPGLKALVLQLYYQAGLSEPKLWEVLTTFGFEISATQISDWLIHRHQPLFEAEKQAIMKAGLSSTKWQHFDHTGTRGLGQNLACHILCNPYYSAFFTLKAKDRLSVLRVLLGDCEPPYCYNEQADQLLERMGLPRKWRKGLSLLEPNRLYQKAQLELWLGQHLPKLGEQGRKLVLDALAIVAYQSQTQWPVVEILVSDDAPQFNFLTQQSALCWIHELRHFAKLEPRLEYHRKILEAWLGQAWRYYDRLLAYTQKPSEDQATFLKSQFEELFKPGGEYHQLDKQIEKSRSKRAQLLVVLDHPELPLHNNPAELGARQRVRKLDVSLAAASQAGLRAWDALQTVVATARKLGVNVYHYLLDRVSGKEELPSLAKLIEERARGEPSFSYYPSEKSREQSQKARAKHGRGGRRVVMAAQPQAKPGRHKSGQLGLAGLY